MARTFIYHGSYTKVEIPKIIQGKHTKDFGTGFYCTIIKEQAERWAKRYTTPKVNVYSILLDSSLDILEFKTMSDDWLDFIIACRSGKTHKHDAVIGAMADDQIYNFISDYIDGTITREQFWVLAKFKYPTHQIAFCSEASLKCIRFENCEDVK